jgi:hypothetical protein
MTGPSGWSDINRRAVPRSNRNDNFIDKSFTVMADLIVKLLRGTARRLMSLHPDGPVIRPSVVVTIDRL